MSAGPPSSSPRSRGTARSSATPSAASDGSAAASHPHARSRDSWARSSAASCVERLRLRGGRSRRTPTAAPPASPRRGSPVCEHSASLVSRSSCTRSSAACGSSMYSAPSPRTTTH
eukprot:scaffold33987_cov42-Phaeocystis_antarctica.AAC.1